MVSSIPPFFLVNPKAPTSHFILYKSFPWNQHQKHNLVMHTRELLFSFFVKDGRNSNICSSRDFSQICVTSKSLSVVSDNALRKAMEFSLLTSAIYFLPREGLLRQKRRELAAMTQRWINYNLFISYLSQSSLNVDALKLLLWRLTGKRSERNSGLFSINWSSVFSGGCRGVCYHTFSSFGCKLP